MSDPLGPRHREVRRLRELARDRRSRAAQGAFILEGPRVVAGALDRGAVLEAAYLAPGADRAFRPLCERLVAAGVRVEVLKEGVLERIGTAVTPQPVLAVAALRTTELERIGPADGLVLVAVGVSDPGNAGAMLRSAEAAGVAGVVFCGDSVDAHNPKTVRASAGAIFGVPVVEADDAVDVLDAVGAQGRRRVGAVAKGGEPYGLLDLTGRVALVVGNEAHGLPAGVTGRLDARVTIPMAASAESLNVAMAATVLCFESRRQRAEQKRHLR